MTRPLALAAALLAVAAASRAQQPTPAPAATPFVVGNPLGLPMVPGPDGAFAAISPDVKVYGGIYSAESCSYDPARGVIVVPNRGVPQNVQTNDAFVSFVNHDGSVHTARWIGVQSPADRAKLAPPLVLNEPYGSDIANGMLYVADRDGGTSASDPSVAVIRRFDLRTGAPAGAVRVPGVDWINDIEVADDGTIYATRTGAFGDHPDPATWQVWKIDPSGTASVFVQGAPLFQPNGIAFDPQGNVVVVNIGDDAVLTFARDGRLLATEHAAQAGSDGLVVMGDGTKYVSSVRLGGVSRIRPGAPAELIARNIPSAASMCYDAGANQLVIPMNPNNGLAFVPLGATSGGSFNAVAFEFARFADIFGSRLVAAFQAIPAARYGYRPTPVQQSVGYIAQHLEDANYALCERLGPTRHAATAKDSLADSAKARWPKDTLVARLRASLRFCDAAIEGLGPVATPALASTLLAFETDLAEHYSQIAGYMRQLGLVPPSALKPRPRTAIALPASELARYVGSYQLVPGLQIDVTLRDGALFAQSNAGGGAVRLWPERADAFFVKEADIQLTFTRDASGAVTGLVLHQYDRDRPATRIR